MVAPEEAGSEAEAQSYDIQTAADIQAKLIPKVWPRISGYDLAALYRPCKTVSGDYFDFIKLDDKRYGMLIADVSGKGVSGGFIMAQVRTYMHNNPQVLGSPYICAVSLNDYLKPLVPPGMFMTMFYFVLHVPTGQVACVNCGHNPLILYHSLTRDVRQVGAGGMPVGVATKQIFQAKINEFKLPLGKDDLILQYTDGVNEAMNVRGEEFGIDRTAKAVVKHAVDPCSHILDAIQKELFAFAGSDHLPDDCTMIALKRIEAVYTAPQAAKAPAPVDKLVSIAEASKKTGVPEQSIRQAMRNGQIRSQFVENVWDYMVVESDVARVAQHMGQQTPAQKPKVLLVCTHSNFSDIITLELRRNQKIEARIGGFSNDCLRIVQQFEPKVVLVELADANQKTAQLLFELKKICPVAEFMVYMNHPEIGSQTPEMAYIIKALSVKHLFDIGKGSRPILLSLSSKIAGAGATGTS